MRNFALSALSLGAWCSVSVARVVPEIFPTDMTCLLDAGVIGRSRQMLRKISKYLGSLRYSQLGLQELDGAGVQPARPRSRQPQLLARLEQRLALEVVLLDEVALLVGQASER